MSPWLYRAISARLMGVGRRANVSRRASVNRNGGDAAAPEAGDFGPALDYVDFIL